MRDLLSVFVVAPLAVSLAVAPLAAQAPDTLVVTTDTVLVTQTGVELPELDEPTTRRGGARRTRSTPRA